MPFKKRVFGAGKLVLLAGALVTTYLVFGVVSMRLALRTRDVPVPNLAGHSANEATALAARVDLTLKVDDSRRADPLVEAGRIVAQDPPAGSTTRRQRSIKVWLSAGAHEVPKLVGETERAAQQRLALDGIAVAGIAEIRSPNYPSDVVVAQTAPADGSAGGVTLLVNRGDSGASYVMPDLIGVAGDRAAEILRGQGLRVAVVAASPYPGAPAGVVLRQTPQAGYQVLPSASISLEVSQ
ncbi:MAG: PASTA domain-containing protein [Vicinamibacterales bacterium]